MTPAEALIQCQEARANEAFAADQLRTVLDHVARALESEALTTRDKLDLGKLALDLHARFRERIADAAKQERMSRALPVRQAD